MASGNLPSLLDSARSRISEARALLVDLRSARMDECAALLREAQGYLEWLRDSLPAGAAVTSLREPAVALAREIRQADVLLARAARFGRLRTDRLRTGSGYTPAGRVATPLAGGCFSWLG